METYASIRQEDLGGLLFGVESLLDGLNVFGIVRQTLWLEDEISSCIFALGT